MLAKKHRLNLALTENSSIFSKDNSAFLSSSFFLAYFRKNQDFLKVACISPKAALNKATLRNKYRRLMFSFVEEEISNKKINLKRKFDLVIVLKRKFNQEETILKKDFLVLIDKICAKNL